MSEQKPPKTAAEVLKHLVRFVESPEEVARMTPDEIRVALVDEGVDIALQARKLHQRLDNIRKQRRLQTAREERVRAENQSTDTSPLLPAHSLREEVIRRLGRLNFTQAQAYFRNMEESTESDLQEMLKDLERLEAREDEQR